MNKRRLIVPGLVGLFGVLVLHQLGDIRELASTLHNGQPIWLVIALTVQLLWFLNQVTVYQSLYTLLELPATTRQLFPVVLASNLINFATSSASLGALPLFLNDAQRRGLDPGRVTLTNVLRLVLNLLWFSLLLVYTLTMLVLWHRLKSYHVIAAAMFLTSAALIIGVVTFAAVRPDGLAQVLARVTRLVNWWSQRLRRRDLVEDMHVRRFAAQFGAAGRVLWRGRQKIGRPCGHIMLYDLLQMAVLYAILMAFPTGAGVVSLARLVTAFSLGVLFSVVAITPQGVGAVEGVLVAAFISLGVPMGQATVVVLVYRGFTFWLPLLVGVVALRWVRGRAQPAVDPGPDVRRNPGGPRPVEGK